MKSIGSTLMFLAVLAIGLDFLGRVPTVLMWIYSWGTTTAWIIKIGLLLLGAALWFLGADDEEETATDE